MSEVTEYPEDQEGDDRVNDPDDVEKINEGDLEDAPELDDEDEKDEFDTDPT